MAEGLQIPDSALGGMPAMPSLRQQFAEAQTENASAMQDLDKAKKDSSAARLAGKEKIEGIQKNAPAVPDLKPLPENFQHKGMDDKAMTDAMQTMFVFAALGGAMTRTPMTGAMKAFGGALKGLAQGDQVAFQREGAEFDRNLKVAMQKNNEALAKYKASFEKHKGDLSAALQEIQLEAAAHNDTVTGALARANNAKGVMQQIQSMASTAAKIDSVQKNFELRMKAEERRHQEWQARIEQGNRRLEEVIRSNQARETNTADRNATYRQRMEGAGKQGLKGKAADAFVHNESNIEALGDVLKQIDENPDAFGFKTMMPGIVLNRMDAEGTPVRAALANITSMTIKDRAGTAQTASEMKNLAPFIPRDGDDVQTVKTKINSMITEMARMNKHLSGGASASPAGAAPHEPFSDPDKEKRYQDWKAKQGGG